MENVMQTSETVSNKKSELISFISEKHEKGYYNAALMSILHKAQEIYGYISEEAIDTISTKMEIPSARIWGIVTFYHYFTLIPRGKYIISVCLGTACYVKGSKRVLNKLKEILGTELNETTSDGLFTIEAKYCLGCCGLAPVMMINGKVYEKLTTKKIAAIIHGLRAESDLDFAAAVN